MCETLTRSREPPVVDAVALSSNTDVLHGGARAAPAGGGVWVSDELVLMNDITHQSSSLIRAHTTLIFAVHKYILFVHL